MAASSSSATESATRPDRLPTRTRLAYGFGGVNEMFGHWLYASLVSPVFNMTLGLAPTLVGTVVMIGRLTEAFTDVCFGWMSDNARTRWGRRRPFILLGSIAAGVALPCLFLIPAQWDAAAPWISNRVFWFMLVTVLLYAPLIGLFSMPYACLGNELTPSYDERTSAMAYKAVFQKCAGIGIAAAWWITRSFQLSPSTGQPDVLAGARFVALLAGAIMIVAGITCVRGVGERYYERARSQAKTGFWRSCRDVFSCRPFLLLLGIVVTVAVPTAIANDLGTYAGTYYVFGGDQDAMSRYHFLAGVGQLACGLVGVFLASALARRAGKREALAALLVFGALAYGSSWWLYAPGATGTFLLHRSIVVVSSTGLWVLAPSMCADVLDFDELQSGRRREGAFNSWMSWVIKLSLAAAPLASGLILDVTGFRALAAEGQSAAALWWMRCWFATIPLVALAAASAMVWRYPLGRERVQQLRQELESRRGRV